MPRGVDEDIQDILAKLRKMRPKRPVRPEPAKSNTSVQAMAQAFRDRMKGGDDLIARNTIYPEGGVLAGPTPGVIPAKYFDLPARDGTPALGVDTRKMTDEEKKKVWSQLPVEEQEWLADKWGMGGQ